MLFRYSIEYYAGFHFSRSDIPNERECWLPFKYCMTLDGACKAACKRLATDKILAVFKIFDRQDNKYIYEFRKSII